MTRFADHFAPLAADYASFRPTYPAVLFAWLAKATPGHALAWDCAAGSGQASLDLARHFRRVVASDASAAQIAAAPPHPGVEYRVAPAESSGLEDACADLITVAQALHWFDLERFYAEARRVLAPGGILAVWTYGVLHVEDEAVDRALQTFYRDTVGPYWPPERRLVESGYRTLPFPFPELEAPPFSMEAEWNLAQLLGYLRSWSATGRFIAERGYDPVAELEQLLSSQPDHSPFALSPSASLRRALSKGADQRASTSSARTAPGNSSGDSITPPWSDPVARRRVTWPLSLRVGRKAAVPC